MIEIRTVLYSCDTILRSTIMVSSTRNSLCLFGNERDLAEILPLPAGVGTLPRTHHDDPDTRKMMDATNYFDRLLGDSKFGGWTTRMVVEILETLEPVVRTNHPFPDSRDCLLRCRCLTC